LAVAANGVIAEPCLSRQLARGDLTIGPATQARAAIGRATLGAAATMSDNAAMRAKDVLALAAIDTALCFALAFAASALAQLTDADFVAPRDAYRSGVVMRLGTVRPNSRIPGSLPAAGQPEDTR